MVVPKMTPSKDRSSLRTLLVAGGVALCLLLACALLLVDQPVNLALAEGECWKGSNATRMERYPNLQTSYKLEEFLEGPGLERVAEDGRAACKFQVDDHSQHFPHAMQQIYRCFSWWQANPTATDYFLIMPRKQPLDQAFLKGMVENIRRIFQVRVVYVRDDLPVVRPIIGYSFEEEHSFAMRSAHDAQVLRKEILRSNNLPTSSCQTNQPVRIGFIDRKQSRSLQNIGAIIRTIERSPLGQQGVLFQTVYFETASFEEQIEFMATSDIIVTPHGAQLTSIPFMPVCGRILEFFPAGYHVPAFFGSLAAVSGIAHSFMYLGTKKEKELAVGMKDLDSRTTARAGNLCPDAAVVADAVQSLAAEWLECCKERIASGIPM